MQRDWVGHGIQLVVVVVLAVPIIFGAAAKFADQGTQIAVLQAQQTAIQQEFAREELRHAAFETEVAKKLDAAVLQLGAISTDLALLRKEVKR